MTPRARISGARRDEAVRRIREHLAEAANGHGAGLVLHGPAGIGKTHLLRTAETLAREHGLRALRARCGELECDFPHGVVRQLLESVVSSAGRNERSALFSGTAALAAPLFAADAATFGTEPSYGLLHGLYWLIGNLAEQEPLLLAVDDVQWGDEASLGFLTYLAARLDGLPVALVATLRTGEQRAADPAVERLLDAAGHDGQLAVGPLDEDAVAAVLRERLGVDPDPAFAVATREWTAGNPLLVQALAGVLPEHGIAPTAQGAAQIRDLAPEPVARFALRRLAAAGPDAAALAQAVAVLGAEADAAQAATLAGLTRDAADAAAARLVRADVLGPGTGLSFVHPVVRRAVYDSVGALERERLHAAAASLLRERQAPIAEVARHLFEVRPSCDGDTVAVLAAAAEQAVAEGAPAAAARWLERALREPPSEAERPRILRALGIAEVRVRPAAAVRHLEVALESGMEGDDLADAAVELANALSWLGRPDDMQAVLERALAQLEGHPARVRVLADLAWLSGYRAEQADLAARLLADIEPEQCADDIAGRQLLGLLASRAARRGDRPDEARRLARASLANGVLLRRRGAPAFTAAVGVLAHLDAFDEALEVFGEALSLARRTGNLPHFAMAAFLRAETMLRMGDLREAEADARTALDAVDALHSLHAGNRVLADVLLEQGDVAAATAWLPDATAEVPGAWEWAYLRATRGRVRLAQGRHEDALDDFLTAGRWLIAMHTENPSYVPWRSDAALALAALGRADEAGELAREEVDLARRWGAPRAEGRALRALALATRSADAVDVLRASAGVLATSPARLERARTLVELGVALRRDGHRSEAREPLAEGIDEAARCGATALLARAREELAATGARPRRTRRRGADALTPSEARVARRAAAGRTNREIAQELFVTPKTIELHLSHAYAKLGIRSRSQLRDALGDA